MNKLNVLSMVLMASCLASPAQAVDKKTTAAAGTNSAVKARIEKATSAIKLAPTAANYSERAKIYSENKLPTEAVADDSKAIELEPKKAFYWIARGVDYTDLKSWDKAIADANKGMSLSKKGDADYINALRLRADCYDNSGKQKLADADMAALEALGADKE